MQLLVIFVLATVLMGLTAHVWRHVMHVQEAVIYCYQYEQLRAVCEGALAYGVHQFCHDSVLKNKVVMQRVYGMDQDDWQPFIVHVQYHFVGTDVLALTITILHGTVSSIKYERTYFFDLVYDGAEIRQLRGRGEENRFPRV